MKQMSRNLAILACLTLVTVAGSAPKPPIEATPERYRLQVAADPEGRDTLSAMGIDIAGHNLAADQVEVIATAGEYQRIIKAGFVVEILELREHTRPLGAGDDDDLDGPLFDTKYTDPLEMELFLQGVAADHPAITRLVDLGTTAGGLTIWGMMISDNAAVDEDELSILFNANHHAREVMTPEVIMDTIDWLTDNYGADPDLTAKVDTYQIWCVPIVNPDGNMRVHTVDDFWRKNTRDNDLSGTITSQDGVDLNRNYEWGWGYQCRGSSGSFSSQTYRGPSEGSEEESRAMLALGRKYRPVFDLEYHSYGEDVFYAMSCDPQFNPKLSTIPGTNKDISRVIAGEYSSRIIQADGGTGFVSAPYGSRVDGTGRDHQYHENGSIAFVTEVNNSFEGGFHPDYDTYRQPTVEGQRPGWLFLIDRISGPSIGGHVTDAITGDPVAADLSLDEMTLPDGKRLTSRQDTGRYHLIVVDGSYTLHVSAPGYDDQAVPLIVTGATTVIDVALIPTGNRRIVLEDFETASTVADWTVGAAGDNATSGVWVAASPHGTHSGDVVNSDLQFGSPRLDGTPGEGTIAFVTGHAESSSMTLADVDGGVTSLVSPSYDLSGWYNVEVGWQRWFRKEPADASDTMTAEVSVNGGNSWADLETLVLSTSSGDATPAWMPVSYVLDPLVALGPDVRFRFQARDLLIENVVEAALDDFELRGFSIPTQGRIGGLLLGGGANTVMQWDGVSGGAGAVYDVLRGDLSVLSGDGSGVSLGALSCIENDSNDTATSGGDTDSTIPVPGQGFFYLVRFQFGLTSGDLGAGSAGGVRTGSGGCS